jgi:hypothetical protein
MKSRTLFAAAMILLTPLVVLAFQTQSEQVRKSELNSRSFSADPLKITLAEFYGGGLRKPNGEVIIEVENASSDFTTFDPRRLSFIDKDDNQADILGLAGNNESEWKWIVPAEIKRIGPKAKIKNLYALTDKVRLPVRLYYEDKLLGTIIE